MEIISKSEKETYEIAEGIAKKAKGGDVFALFGDLGSGKTTFAKGFAKVLGVKKTITSPTFVIFKTYSTEAGNEKLLLHLDCYRLGSEIDAEAIGLPELLGRSDVVSLIEWPEKIEKILPADTKVINFQYLSENSRKIEIK